MTSISSLSHLTSLSELAVDGNPLAALQSSAAVRLEVIARSPSSLDMLDGRQVSWLWTAPRYSLPACRNTKRSLLLGPALGHMHLQYATNSRCFEATLNIETQPTCICGLGHALCFARDKDLYNPSSCLSNHRTWLVAKVWQPPHPWGQLSRRQLLGVQALAQD